MTESCEFDVVDVEHYDEGSFSTNSGSCPSINQTNQAALFQAALAQAQSQNVNLFKQQAIGQINQIQQNQQNQQIQHNLPQLGQVSPGSQFGHEDTLDMSTSPDTPMVRAGTKRSPVEREEMVMRKKLRNRESAQRARDRQKAKMRWLEEEMQKIKVRNEQLLRENLILRHMMQGNGLINQMPQGNSQIQQLNQQIHQNSQMTQPIMNQQQQNAQRTLQNLQSLPKTGTNQQVFKHAGSHKTSNSDSEGSIPSIISTGSQNVISPQINQNGDDLLKAASQPRNQQQQYAAALAAIAQQNPIQANLALLQNPNQLAAAMAQATVVAAQNSINQVSSPVSSQNSPNKTRPSSVGPGSGCHTSDAISE